MAEQKPKLSDVIRSVPVKLNWLGWEANTHVLRRKGWKIFGHEMASERCYGTEISIGARDPDNLLVLYAQFLLTPDMLNLKYAHYTQHNLLEMVCNQGLDVVCYRATDRIRDFRSKWDTSVMLNEMSPIDGMIGMVEFDTETVDLKKMKLFNYEENVKEVILPPDSVEECLNRILELQCPTETVGEEGLILNPNVQAKIYSLEDV